MPAPLPTEQPSSLDPVPLLENALDVLDRFGQALQKCSHSSQQVRLILESVRAALRADTVFWDSGSPHEPVEIIGKSNCSSSFCRTFRNWLTGDDDQIPTYILRSDIPNRPDAPCSPTSAALVRISRSHRSWLGALNFGARRAFAEGDIRVMLLARRMLLSHRQQALAQDKLRDSLFGLVRCLAAAIDAKDSYTFGHSERVARIAVRLGKEMNLGKEVLSDLFLAGLLHDIGKIGIRDSVLQKPGKLTDDERQHIQEHTIIGDRLVSVVSPLLHLRSGVRNHHEQYDGSGYPDRLRGEEIPLLARVLAVADACDAMMANRPYRTALTPQRIDAIMAEGAGRQWDPTIIAHFLNCRHELYSICQRGLGDSVIVAVDHVLERVHPVEESARRQEPVLG